MTSCAPTSAQVWNAALTAFEQRLHALVDDAHADWLDLWGGAISGGLGSGEATAWRDWACALAVDRPALSELADPLLRMALLPPEQAQRVLVMRALLPRRAQVRTCIDPSQRAELCAAVGNPALQALVAEGHDVSHGLSHRSTDQGLPEVSALSWEGYQLFAADGAWHDEAGLARLLRLRFPREGAPLFARASDPTASRWVLQRLPLLVKEQSWWSDSTGMIFMSTWN
jgi:Bacterial type III secretion protein (HrpB4)